jgi:hypothetical protein
VTFDASDARNRGAIRRVDLATGNAPVYAHKDVCIAGMAGAASDMSVPLTRLPRFGDGKPDRFPEHTRRRLRIVCVPDDGQMMIGVKVRLGDIRGLSIENRFLAGIDYGLTKPFGVARFPIRAGIGVAEIGDNRLCKNA